MRTPSLAYRVTTELRTAITDGAFDLGEPLSEDALSEIFDVSRTPVREALRQLQAEGLVDVVPKSGTYIFKPTEEDIIELADWRLMMEASAAKLAVERDHKTTSEALKSLLPAMKAALEADDRREYNRLDARFHQTFVNHSANRYLQSSYALHAARVAALRAHLSVVTIGATAVSMAEHARIAELADAQDTEEIVSILEVHILRSRTSYTAILRARSEANSATRRERMRHKLMSGLRPLTPEPRES